MYYHSFNEEMKKRFGTKVYKVALDGGFTCPNRDGTVGTGGCIFCSARGSGDFTFQNESIENQLEYGIALVSAKNKDGKYIAYFQNFTGTYGKTERLKDLYTRAISHPDVAALSVATRPDCLGEDVVSLLRSINEIKPVWVELGLQTVHEQTAEYIRRGYALSVYDDAVSRLKDVGIEVITHMIIGLPGESEEDMVATARYIGQSGADGIKLQLLHVLEGTDLARDFSDGKFVLPTLDEYCRILGKCISVLPKEMVIHRLTGDGAKAELIAPIWSGNKKMVLNTVNKYFRDNNIIQGSALI